MNMAVQASSDAEKQQDRMNPWLGRTRHGKCRSTYCTKTVATKLRIINKSTSKINVIWVDYDGVEQHYETLKPGHQTVQSSFSTHIWRFKASDKALVSQGAAVYVGPSAVLHVLNGGWLEVKPLSTAAAAAAAGGGGGGGDNEDTTWVQQEWGSYRERARVLGMAVMAYDCVCDAAVSTLCCCISNMMASARPDVLARLVEAGCNLAIIGKGQVTTDIPAHHFMLHQAGATGRDVNTTARGLGATRAVPTASCGEENITMVDDRHYPLESILVHEFAHAVMNLGFSQQDMKTIRQLFRQAQQHKLYDPDCYMMENADEYWAEASQAWFGATVRKDVNSGINTRQLLQQHDSGLAHLLEQVYGKNTWQYTDTCPAALKAPGRHCTEPNNRKTRRNLKQGQAAAGASNDLLSSQQQAKEQGPLSAGGGAPGQLQRHWRRSHGKRQPLPSQQQPAEQQQQHPRKRQKPL